MEGQATPLKMQFDARYDGGTYVQVDGERRAIPREKLVSLASEGRFVGTFTGRHGAKDDYDSPQPALWTHGPIHQQRGRQQFPVLYGENRTMTISGRHLEDGAHVIINGRRVPGTITARTDKDETVEIELEKLPEAGIHFLQVQNEDGLFSNDFIFHVAEDEEQANLVRYLNNSGSRPENALHEAVARGDLGATRNLLKGGASPNDRNGDGGLPLSAASLHGHLEIAKLLIEKGAQVSGSNRDGNTPLHVAAFLCRTELVKLLLEEGASVTERNGRQESPLDVVSGEWSEPLGGFYQALSEGAGLGLDLEEIRQGRPKMAELLREHAASEKKDGKLEQE